MARRAWAAAIADEAEGLPGDAASSSGVKGVSGESGGEVTFTTMVSVEIMP